MLTWLLTLLYATCLGLVDNQRCCLLGYSSAHALTRVFSITNEMSLGFIPLWIMMDCLEWLDRGCFSQCGINQLMTLVLSLVHYQKFAKYQRIYRWNISVGNLRSKLPTDTFPSVIQSVTTNGNFSVCNSVGSVVTDGITDEKVSELKKRRVADVEVLAGHSFPTTSPTDSKTTPVQWCDRCAVYITDGLVEGFEMADLYGDVSMFSSESQTWSPTDSPTEYPLVNPSVKVNICQLCRPSPPLFLLLLS